MNRSKIHKAHSHSKAPYLDPFPRLLLFCIGAYFVVSTATQVFSQAPLVAFLMGCAFAFAGINGLRLTTFSFSNEGFKFESYKVPFQTPVTHRMLKRHKSDTNKDLGDKGWTPVEINGITKQSIAGIATTASGETMHPDQINSVYAIKDDINHLLVFTSDGRTLNLDFAQVSESDSRVGIQ